jgi:hypothetical protein
MNCLHNFTETNYDSLSTHYPMGGNYKASRIRKTTMQSHGLSALFMSASAAIGDSLRWGMELRVSRFWFRVVRKHAPKT